ncbi:hypothetical protein BDA96_02G249200 [Sorghum bicolor]|uniref:Carboxypeptidase n=2 Tax=Sorghum bicolor TaxID=4558 RepID=A0A921UU03_SORBI|nr:hypothetical protein BDA96_02G249200 [Sorghum bicolor]KXG35852.1 hypothetical protein SORBI_3002G238200 [Sorghum bicolor]
MRSNNASSLLYVLLIICAAALHSDASQQEEQLRKFIRSRRDSRSNKNTFRVNKLGNRVASSLLSTSYSDSEQSALKAADKITALPGQPDGVGFDQYSGYVTVDEKNGRALFYYFVEAPQDASTKPLLLWLNGGPGCSSFGIGAMQELIGPFRVNNDNKTLSRNKNAWNNVANVIFLESPAGVGFSYSNTSSDYDLSGDQRTADDAYLFLINWLERFPEYKSRPFYISGESYAGHYVPELAATILIQNSYNSKTVINLRGILVGNPLLDLNMNFKDEVFANITRHCHFDNSDSDGVECNGALNGVDPGHIDGYNIYAPICVDAANGAYYPSGYLPGGYDPCSYHYTNSYLNDPAVQNAFHARMTSWSGCAYLNWTDSPISMVPTISWLVQNKLPVWVFSGDFDSVCPLPTTRYSIHDLNLRITTPWRPWTVNMEVGGYVQQYKGGFTFVSVRGAGHMVPSSQPERALVLLDSFFKGVLPPYPA